MSTNSETFSPSELALRFTANRGRNHERANFFEAMAVFLTETLGVSYAFVAKIDETNPANAATLALANNNTVLPNATFPLTGSPCEKVLSEGACQITSGVQQKFPDDTMLVDIKAEGYVGVVLPSTNDEPMGHIAILHKEPIDDIQTVHEVLSILSTSAGWEIERITNEAKLKESERRFRDFAEASSDWYWETDKDHRFNFISENIVEATGVPNDFYIGKTRWETCDDDPESDFWREHIEKLNHREAFRGLEYQRVGPHGENDHMRVSGVPIYNEHHKFTGYRGVASIISEQKKLELALQDSDSRYERAMRHAAIWEWEISTSDFFVSPRLGEILGYSEKEFDAVMGGSIYELLHPDDASGFAERLNVVLKFPDTVFEEEQRLRHKSGQYIWFEIRGRIERDLNDDPLRISGLIIDVSDRKEMEQSLSKATERAIKAERRLFGAINSIQDSFVIFDSDDRLVLFNEEYKKDREMVADLLEPGVKFEDIFRENVMRGRYVEAIGREEEWFQERLKIHQACQDGIEYKLNDGRWMRVSERKTPDGDKVGVRVDITLFKQAQELAESANKAKSEFLSSMSHELRTPLNAILGFGQLLQNNNKNPLTDSQQRAVNHILNSGSHLLTLIDDVLDLAKVEAGQERMSIENTEIPDVIESCLLLVQSTAQEHGIQIINNLNPECTTVLADYTRMKQIIVNLLTNAIKYNSENGTVTIESECLDDTTRISVTDTGPGIAPDRYEELFQPFSRLGAETTEIEGTGIGLTICKRLIELMDGTISIESKLGEGSTFWIELPTSTSSSLPPPKEEAKDQESIDQKPKSSSTNEGFSVLYVEDNPTNIRLMEQIIDLVPDATLTSTHTAENALEMVSSLDPNLILMDINLPGMNGIQALNRLKASPDTASTPVIAISADAIPESIQRGLEAGFHAYLTKPIRVDEILDIIESIR